MRALVAAESSDRRTGHRPAAQREAPCGRRHRCRTRRVVSEPPTSGSAAAVTPAVSAVPVGAAAVLDRGPRPPATGRAPGPASGPAVASAAAAVRSGSVRLGIGLRTVRAPPAAPAGARIGALPELLRRGSAVVEPTPAAGAPRGRSRRLLRVRRRGDGAPRPSSSIRVAGSRAWSGPTSVARTAAAAPVTAPRAGRGPPRHRRPGRKRYRLAGLDRRAFRGTVVDGTVCGDRLRSTSSIVDVGFGIRPATSPPTRRPRPLSTATETGPQAPVSVTEGDSSFARRGGHRGSAGRSPGRAGRSHHRHDHSRVPVRRLG